MQKKVINFFGVNGANGVNTVEAVQSQAGFNPIRSFVLPTDNLLRFPIECFPVVLKSFVESAAESMQTDIDMVAIPVLGAIAIAAQGKYEVEDCGGHREPINLYTAVFAKPGERKSGVLKLITEAIIKYDASLKEKHFVFDDCTSEALTERMALNGGVGAVVSPEGGVFDILAGRYTQQPNLDIWLKGHPGDFLRVDRKKETPLVIQHPLLSTILMVQPSILEEIMRNRTMQKRGLIARFLFAFPRTMVGHRDYFHPALSEEAKCRYEDLILNLLNRSVSKPVCILKFSEECNDTLAEYFDKTEKYALEAGETFREWCAKYFGTVRRIAGLLQISEDPDSEEISLDTLQKAIKIGEYFRNHAEYAFSLIGEDDLIASAKFVAKKLKKIPEALGGMKRNQVYRKCRSSMFQKAEDIIPVLDLLEEYGWIKVVVEYSEGPGKKPDSKVFLNPKASEIDP